MVARPPVAVAVPPTVRLMPAVRIPACVATFRSKVAAGSTVMTAPVTGARMVTAVGGVALSWPDASARVTETLPVPGVPGARVNCPRVTVPPLPAPPSVVATRVTRDVASAVQVMPAGCDGGHVAATDEVPETTTRARSRVIPAGRASVTSWVVGDAPDVVVAGKAGDVVRFPRFSWPLRPKFRARRLKSQASTYPDWLKSAVEVVSVPKVRDKATKSALLIASSPEASPSGRLMTVVAGAVVVPPGVREMPRMMTVRADRPLTRTS